MAAQSAVVITTLKDDGVTASTPKLTLMGRALPYPGLELEAGMNAEFTWYPGNAVATVQMLGASQKATTIKGMWKDRFLMSLTEDDPPVEVQPTAKAVIDGQQVADVRALVLAVEQMQLSGLLLKFEWGTVVRVGILTRFRQNWTRFEDCEWEMEFQWVSRGEKQSPPTVPLKPDSASFSASIQDAMARLSAALEPPSFQVIESFLATVDTAFAVIEDAATSMSDAVVKGIELTNKPDAVATRALVAADSIAGSASDIITAVEGTPVGELIKTATPEALTFGDTLIADNYSRELKAASRNLQSIVASMGDDLRASLDLDDLLAAFVARAPMDLRDISQRFYDSPDQWRTLLAYNELETSAVFIGQLILVPKIDTGAG